MSSEKNLAEKPMSHEGDAPAIIASNHSDSSAKNRIDALDIGLKERQIVKTELEIAQLTKTWPRLLDIVSKAGIPIVVIVTGVAAYIGLPQATIDLGKARTETKLVQSQLVALMKQKAKIEKESAEANVDKKELINDLKVSPQGIDQVFVQFKGNIARETINGLRAVMLTAGFKAPPAVRIDSNQKNMVKYFSSSPEEKARATKVAAATKEFFEKQRCPLGDVKVEKIELPGGKNAPIELWLDHACKTMRP